MGKTIEFGAKERFKYEGALADTASITLPTITSNYPAHGYISCAHASTGAISESAEFEFGSNGQVELVRGSANVYANHETMTLDQAPAPAGFSAGGTITGASSGVTCTVVSKTSSTVYIVKNRSGAWTDGETVGDGTNTGDQGAGYPAMTTYDGKLNIGSSKVNPVVITNELGASVNVLVTVDYR